MPPKYRKETYIFFKPKNDNYSSIHGEMIVRLEVRWHGEKNWKAIGNEVSFELDQSVSNAWNIPNTPPIQVASKNFMNMRSGQ